MGPRQAQDRPKLAQERIRTGSRRRERRQRRRRRKRSRRRRSTKNKSKHKNSIGPVLGRRPAVRLSLKIRAPAPEPVPLPEAFGSLTEGYSAAAPAARPGRPPRILSWRCAKTVVFTWFRAPGRGKNRKSWHFEGGSTWPQHSLAKNGRASANIGPKMGQHGRTWLQNWRFLIGFLSLRWKKTW